MASRFIAGLDIGTFSIKAAVAENQGGRPTLRWVGSVPSQGLRRGAVVELAEASAAVGRVLHEARNVEKSALRGIYVNVGTTQLKAQQSHGVAAVARASSEISLEDVERAVRQSQAVTLGPNRMILHTVTREYAIDGVGDIADPVGLAGNRLEVRCLVIDAFAPHVKSVTRVVDLAGGRISGMVASPLLAARSTLSRAQKDLGAVLIDIGFGTTGVSVYEENKLAAVANFPVGSSNITNDLAVGLKIPVSAAEGIKLKAGYAVASAVSPRETVDVSKFTPEAKGTISRRFVAEIIEARLAEIFEFVNNELKLLGRGGQLPGGAVLVGGGAKLPGLTTLAKTALKLSAQIGAPLREEWKEGSVESAFEDPEYAGVLGLLLWGADHEEWQPRRTPLAKIRNALRYFLP